MEPLFPIPLVHKEMMVSMSFSENLEWGYY